MLKFKQRGTHNRFNSIKIIIELTKCVSSSSQLNLRRSTLLSALAMVLASFFIIYTQPSQAASNPYDPCKNGGNCTRYAWQVWHDLGVDLPQTKWGNGKDWIAQAKRAGFATGNIPAVNAIAVFQPGFYTRYPEGHVAIVRQVSGYDMVLEQENCFDAPHTITTTTWNPQVTNGKLEFIYFPGTFSKEENMLIKLIDTQDPFLKDAIWGVTGGKRWWVPDAATLEQRFGKDGWNRIIGLRSDVFYNFPLTTEAKRVYAIATEDANLNKCLDASGISSLNGTRVVLWDCYNIPNQLWFFQAVPNTTDTFYIRSSLSWKCMDVAGGSFENNAFIHMWGDATNNNWATNCHWGRNQQWKKINLGNNIYAFQSVNSNKCMDIGNRINDAKLTQWDCLYPTQQRWRLI